MADIRINKLIRQYNVGLSEMVEFLRKQGLDIDENPNAKVSEDYLPIIENQFHEDQRLLISSEELASDENIISNIESEPQLLKLEVAFVDDLGRLVTKSFDHPHYGHFDAGVLLPQMVFNRGISIPVDLAQDLIKASFAPGSEILALYYSSCLDDTCAILAYEACFQLFSDEDRKFFDEDLTEGDIYHVSEVGDTPNFIIVEVENSTIKGLIRKENIPDDGIIDQLQLVKKSLDISGYSIFDWPSTIEEIDAPYSDDIVARFLGEEAMSAISEEDIVLVKYLLMKNPTLDIKKADIADKFDLYLNLPDNLKILYERHKQDISTKAFWVAVSIKESGERKLFLFHEKPTVVLEVSIDDHHFLISNIATESANPNDARFIIKRFYRQTVLKISPDRLHFIDIYSSIPVGYNYEDVFDYFARLDDFNRNILSRIHETLQSRMIENAHDYRLLEQYLKYQSQLETDRAGDPIEISSGRIKIDSGDNLSGNPTIAYHLYDDEVTRLLGNSESTDESSIHISVVDEDGIENRAFASTMTFRDGLFVQTFKNPNVDVDQFLSDGLLIRQTCNTKPYDIQISAIKDFLREGVFRNLIVDNLDIPDEEKYNKINYFNPVFYSQEPGSNQCAAVKKALGNKNMVLIQGPPGTGKTTIIVEIIKQLVKEGKRVLVCSQAHAAVGNIRERFDETSDRMKILRIDDDGDVESWSHLFQPEEHDSFLRNNQRIIDNIACGEPDQKIKNSILSYNYGEESRTTEYHSMHQYIYDHINVLDTIEDKGEISNMLTELLDAPSDIDRRMLEAQLYQSMDVIMGTCIGIGMNKVLGSGTVLFDTVIIDEAAKANLSEALVPMGLGRRFVLVGDHNQLPPYVDRDEIKGFVDYQEEIQEGLSEDKRTPVPTEEETYDALSNSVFAYFYNHNNFPDENKVTLNYQYRMHPEIGEYISDLFYNGVLHSGKGTDKKVLSVPGLPDAVTFIDTKDNSQNLEKKTPDRSLYNIAEANVIHDILLPVLTPILAQDDSLKLGIITPYKAQYRLLKHMLKDSDFERCVYTIDSIQGSEFDVVIFSFVRSFQAKFNKKVGFIDDMRRLNVSLSRAKRKLFLIGNSRTLLNEDAHTSSVHFAVRPIDVFRKICENREKVSNADDLFLFLQNEPQKGTVFHNCQYSDRQKYIVVDIPIADRVFKFKVATYGESLIGRDNVDVIYKGSSDKRKPSFDLTFYSDFKKIHSVGEILIATINNINWGNGNSGDQIYVTVENINGRIQSYNKSLSVGDKIQIQIAEFNDEKNIVYFAIPSYRWRVIAKKSFPIITIEDQGRCHDISLVNFYHELIPGTSYFFRLSNDKHFITDFKHTADLFDKDYSNLDSFKGQIISEDKLNFYVNVDGTGCILKKFSCDRFRLKVGEVHMFRVFKIDISVNKQIMLKILR